MSSFVTTGVCFWCSADTGVTGTNPERDKRAVLSYDPCASCKSEFDAGIVFFEAAEQPIFERQPPAMQGAYPSGRRVILNHDEVDETFESERAAQLKADRAVYIRPDAFEALFGLEKTSSSVARVAPESAQALAEDAGKLASEGRTPDAIRLIERAIRLDPIGALDGFHALRAELYRSLGQQAHDRALMFYQLGVVLGQKGYREDAALACA